MRFWDSSAIVPLVMAEASTRRIHSLLEADPDVTMWWTSRVECWSAIARSRRRGKLDAAAERRAIGRAILDMIAESNVNLEVVPLPEPYGARFNSYWRAVYVDERLMTYTPHVATMLLLHEIVHAHQERIGQPRTCVERSPVTFPAHTPVAGQAMVVAVFGTLHAAKNPMTK